MTRVAARLLPISAPAPESRRWRKRGRDRHALRRLADPVPTLAIECTACERPISHGRGSWRSTGREPTDPLQTFLKAAREQPIIAQPKLAFWRITLVLCVSRSEGVRSLQTLPGPNVELGSSTWRAHTPSPRRPAASGRRAAPLSNFFAQDARPRRRWRLVHGAHAAGAEPRREAGRVQSIAAPATEAGGNARCAGPQSAVSIAAE
jgi:hypothetical protein